MLDQIARLALHLAVFARVRAEVRQISLVAEHALALLDGHARDQRRCVRDARRHDHSSLMAGRDRETVVGDFRCLGRIVQQHLEAGTVCRRAVVFVQIDVQQNGQAHVAAGTGRRPRIHRRCAGDGPTVTGFGCPIVRCQLFLVVEIKVISGPAIDATLNMARADK